MTLESSFTIVTCLQHSPLESISPTNLCNIQWCQPIVNGAKDAFSISPTILQKFCYMFWATAFAPTPYFGTFLPNVVAIKSIKNYLRKIYEIAPWSYFKVSLEVYQLRGPSLVAGEG
jgi:hypothetical protein